MLRDLISFWMRLLSAFQALRRYLTKTSKLATNGNVKQYDLDNHDFMPPFDEFYDVLSNSESLILWNKMAAMMDYTYPMKGKLVETNLSDHPKQDDLKYCIKYAVYAYFLNILGEPKGIDIVQKRHFDAFTLDSLKVEKAAYFIGIDQVNQKIIVCIRGTANWGDTLTDLDCHPVRRSFGNDSDGKPMEFWVRHGMYDTALKIYDEITSKVKQLSDRDVFKNYKIMLTGHSLGAGSASLLGLLWNVRNDFDAHKFVCCAFASPLIVCQDGMHHSLSFNNMISIAVSTDIVTRLSLPTFQKFHSRLQLISTNKTNKLGLINSIADKRCQCDDYEHFLRELTDKEFDLMEQIKHFNDVNEDKHQYLYPCGDLIWSVPDFVLNNSMSESQRYQRLLRMVEVQSGPRILQYLYFAVNIFYDFFLNQRHQVLAKPLERSDRSKFQEMVYNGLESLHAHFQGRYTALFGLDLIDIFAMSSLHSSSKWRPQWLSLILCVFRVTAMTIKRSFLSL